MYNLVPDDLIKLSKKTPLPKIWVNISFRFQNTLLQTSPWTERGQNREVTTCLITIRQQHSHWLNPSQQSFSMHFPSVCVMT